MLRLNKHDDRGGTDTLVDRCADGLTNGAIPACNVCNSHRLQYADGVYTCKGHISEWSKCTNVLKTVVRTEWQIPNWEEEEEDYEEVKSRSKSPKKRSREEYEEEVENSLAFTGCVFALVGTTFEDKDELIAKIEDNGGTISPNVTKKVTHVITTTEEENKARKPSKLKTAEKYELPIEHEDYIDKEIAKHNKSKKSAAPAKKKQKVVIPSVHIAPPVDSYFDITDECLVVGTPTNGYYSATLSRTDLGDGELGKNSFYIAQVVKKTNKEKYWLYKRWGRVGEPGSIADKEFRSKDKAVNEFKKT